MTTCRQHDPLDDLYPEDLPPAAQAISRSLTAWRLNQFSNPGSHGVGVFLNTLADHGYTLSALNQPQESPA